MNIGIMIKDIEPEWIVVWSKRFSENSYVTSAGTYTVLVVQELEMHEILSLMAEYQLAIGRSKGRILYKQYKHELTINTIIDKLPLPRIDVYLSKEI